MYPGTGTGTRPVPCKKKKLGGDGAPPRHQLRGPPLNSTSHLTPPWAAEIGAPDGPLTANRGGPLYASGFEEGLVPLRSKNSGGLPLFQGKLGGERPAESIWGGLPLHHGLHILLGLGGPRLPKLG